MRTLDFDRASGILESHYYDETTKTNVIRRTQLDVQPILDQNQRMATMNDGYSADRTLRRVASIPRTIYEEWLRQDGIPYHVFGSWPSRERRKYLARKLMDGDYRKLLTAPMHSRRYV